MGRMLVGIFAGFSLSLMIPFLAVLFWKGQISFDGFGEKESGQLVEAGGAEMDSEDLVAYILAAEIPPEAPEEAKKAQAVIARTNLYKAMEETGERDADNLGIDYKSLAELREQYGAEYTTVYQDYRKAASQTCGELLLFQDELINAVFHQASAGSTRDMGESCPYLKAVESGDALCDGYLAVKEMGEEDFAAAANGIDSSRQIALEGISGGLLVEERDGAGYVLSVQAGGQKFSGEELAGALGLPSEAFYIDQREEKIRITSYGIGHGYGLSQAGACRMAKEGKNYQEILCYFYSGVEVKTAEINLLF